MKDDFNKNRKEDNIQTGDQVMYYIGDRNTRQRKLRAKWSGPWIVKKHYENTIEITDPKDPKVTAEIHVARVKPYRSREYYTWKEHEKLLRETKLSEEIKLDLEEENLVF